MLPIEAPASATRRAVIVLGMHRSGTSAVAGTLKRLGIDFGPRLMPATPANPRGYYEHIDIVNLHDRLLLALGRSWDDTGPFPEGWSMPGNPVTGPYREALLAILKRDFRDAPLWGLKDPRLCRLLPWWETIWTDIGTTPIFVILARPAREVAASLASREGFSARKSWMLWLEHILDAERSTRGRPRVFIDFKAFLAEGEASLNRAMAALDLPHHPPGKAAVDGPGAQAPFVDALLSRSSIEAPGSPEPRELPSWITRAEDALRLLIPGGDEDRARAEFDDLNVQLQAAQALFNAPASATEADLRGQLEASRAQARWYESEWVKARKKAGAGEEKLRKKLGEIERLRGQLSK